MMRRGVAIAALAVVLFSLLILASPGSGQRRSLASVVVISEVGWGGTAASTADEWIELYNTSALPVSLDGWQLNDGDGDVAVVLSGTIAAQSFFVLERTDDTTISDRAADQLFTGPLDNGESEHVALYDAQGVLVDTANGNGGVWPAGSGAPDYLSMERVDPLAADSDDNWISNNALDRNGLDADGNPLNGSPGQENASWYAVPTETPSPSPTASGTATAPTATASGPTPTATATAAVTAGATASATASATATVLPEATLTVTPTPSPTLIVTPPVHVLIDAVYYDGYVTNDADEAVRLINPGEQAVDLDGWTLQDAGGSTLTLPAGARLAGHESAWLAKEGKAFYSQWGQWPDFEAKDTVAAVPQTEGSWPGFSNQGDTVILSNPAGAVVDVVVYEEGTSIQGWQGAPLEPYTGGGLFAEEGQVLSRRRDPLTGQPVVDSNRATDWLQAIDDPVSGRRVIYPGWNLEDFLLPAQDIGPAFITIGVAPDNAYNLMLAEISRARRSLALESLTFEHVGVAQALVAAATRGVQVTLLLEGAPVGGIKDQERYVCQQLEAAGGACWFMHRDDAVDIQDRYRYLHAKFMIVDEERVLISSENLSPRSLPDDVKADGTWGHRGLLLVTDVPPVVQRLQAIFDDDFDPATHQDLVRWSAGHPLYGAPPTSFVPLTVTGGITYTVHYPTPVSFQGRDFVLTQAPENSLSEYDGLLSLVAQAGSGDTILVQQLDERFHWGAPDSTPASDPNPRLERWIEAARRGATVRLLLDSYYDDAESGTGNRATCAYLNQLRVRERVSLYCEVANPTGMGIHNKMILLEIGGKGWLSIGSLNGTEQAHKGNREVALLVQSDSAYHYLAAMFMRDWPHRALLPVAFSRYQGPAQHILISEVLYDPPGIDDAEFIELFNPTHLPVDLGGWGLGDAMVPEDYEDLRRFPAGTWLQPQQTLVVATTATAFRARYGRDPDFEILDSDPAVPVILDDLAWGAPEVHLQLGNAGDEVLLRRPDGTLVDALTYGESDVPGMVPCALIPAGHSYERFPAWRDQDNCPVDFREWAIPGPGQLPAPGQ